MNFKKALISVSVVCGVTILALLVVLFYYLNQYASYSKRLENIYRKNLYELVNSVNSIEVDISKIVATTSLTSQQKLLNSIYKSCNDIESNLNNLPISQTKTKKVTNLYNMLSGYSYSLMLENKELSDENLNSLEELHTSCLIVMYDLNNYLNEVTFGYSILEDVDFDNEMKSGFDAGFTEQNNEDQDIPSLIYDGPFSDSVTNKEVKGLKGSINIGRDQAMDIVKDALKGYEIKSVKYNGETNGKFATFNFDVEAKNISLFVQVTKLGGKIISINSNADNGTFEYTEELSRELAQNFANSIGYEDMYPVWSQQTGNIIYVNLAPLVNGVIYYPDLVKVKVDTTNARVVGLDGTNYYYNHVDRSYSNPTISQENAKKKVGSKLNIVDINLAIIPNQFAKETFVYEFVCTWKDYQYYVYVDAFSGEEVEVLRVVKTTQGNLVL